MSIGKTPGTPVNYRTKGTVSAVDVQRQVCKVICEDGRMLTNVQWCPPFGGFGRSGFNYTPIPRERVSVQFDQDGNCNIIGSEHPLGYSRKDTGYLGKVRELQDDYFYKRYNASLVGSTADAGTSRPVDQIPGDATLTQGGGVLGVTNTGSIIAKASSWAQIFITKIDDLVRVVSRNYQQFSEAAKKVQENVAGRVYEYKAYYFTKESSRADTPEYEEVIGDVAAGDFTKGELVDSSTLPAEDERVHQVRVSENGVGRFIETLEIDGTETSFTSDDSGNSATEYKSSNEWSVYIDNGSDSGLTEVSTTHVLIESSGSGFVKVELTPDGKLTLECDDADLTFNGAVTETYNGDVTRTITGNVMETITGNVTKEVTGTVLDTTIGSKTVNATGPLTIDGTPTVIVP